MICVRKILNEVIILVTVKGEVNPLLDNQVATLAFIVLVRLESYMQKFEDKLRGPLSVRVH